MKILLKEPPVYVYNKLEELIQDSKVLNYYKSDGLFQITYENTTFKCINSGWHRNFAVTDNKLDSKGSSHIDE
jgi:hypothetical protein